MSIRLKQRTAPREAARRWTAGKAVRQSRGLPRRTALPSLLKRATSHVQGNRENRAGGNVAQLASRISMWHAAATPERQITIYSRRCFQH